MSGEVTVTLHDNYLLLILKGDAFSPQEVKSTMLEIIEKAINANLHIVIHRDVSVKQLSGVTDFYFYGKFISESSFRNKIALVFPKEMHHQNLEFFITTSKNHGINVSLFTNIEDALKWVNYKSDNQTS